MSDEEYLEIIERMAREARGETEWRNRKSTVDVIRQMTEKMLTRPENVAEWKKVEEAMGRS